MAVYLDYPPRKSQELSYQGVRWVVESVTLRTVTLVRGMNLARNKRVTVEYVDDPRASRSSASSDAAAAQ